MRALGRVVGGIEVEVRQVADQPVRPAGAGQAGLLAGHEFERAMGAEMQHRVGAEILAQPAIEGREGMRRREALLEQQPHRVALVAEGGLDADEDVAELRAEHEDASCRRSAGVPGAGPHCASISAQPALAAHVVVGRDAGVRRWRRCRSAPRCPTTIRSRSASTSAGHLDRVAARASARVSVLMQRLEDRRDRPRCRWCRHWAGS